MVIVTATISILVITTLVWFLNKVLSRKVCPICAGVAGTWIWMLIGILTNQLSVISYQLLVGILMGGSVVGIAYQLEKRLSAGSAGWRTPLLWKILFIPIGFAAVYSLLTFSWLVFGAAAVILVLLAAIFLRRTAIHSPSESKVVKELEKKMEKCC